MDTVYLNQLSCLGNEFIIDKCPIVYSGTASENCSQADGVARVRCFRGSNNYECTYEAHDVNMSNTILHRRSFYKMANTERLTYFVLNFVYSVINVNYSTW